MTAQNAPFSLSWIVTQSVASIRAPRDAAGTILGLNLTVPVLWQLLLLVVVLSVAIGQLVLLMIPSETGQSAAMLFSPFTMAGLQFITLSVMAIAVHVIGRTMGGSGDFAGALAVVTWLQVVLVCVQVVQTFALLLMPPLGVLIGWAALVLFLWMLTNFVAVLHGFKSLGLVFVMILASSLGIVFVFSLVLTILGLGPSGGFNV